MMRGIRFSVLVSAMLLMLGMNPFLSAQTVTNTVILPLPNMWKLMPPGYTCEKIPVLTNSFTPLLPDGATIIDSRISGYVDDACEVIGPGGVIEIGFDNCAPYEFQDVSILQILSSSDGFFEIALYDETDQGLQSNQVQFYGSNIITYVVNNPEPIDSTEENIEEELRDALCKVDPCTMSCEDILKSIYVTADCSDCSIFGSPRASFNLGNFNVRVQDIPVWLETAVGPAIRLEMRFSNAGHEDATRAFGPRWSMNWESRIEELPGGTNRMRFPSGSIGYFVEQGGVYTGPSGLPGELTSTNGVYQYARPDGHVWQYAPSSADPSVFLLDRTWDVWSNTVSVAYTNDRILRVEQTTPATGRYLEFIYAGTNTQVLEVRTDTNAARSAVFSYDGQGRLSDVEDMGGYAYTYEYTNGYLAAIVKDGITDRIRVQYSATPDQWTATEPPQVTLIDSEGHEREYAWHYGLVTERLSAVDKTIQRSHLLTDGGTRGKVIRQSTGSAGSSLYQYSPAGLITNRTDRNGQIHTQTFNSQGRITSHTDPLNHTYTTVYDSNGIDALYVTPPEGPVQETFTYVPDRHVVATASNVMGRVVTYAYNDMGLVTNINDGRATEQLTYNAEGRRTARFRNGSLMETNTYDTAGRLFTRQTASGLSVQYAYDDLNRVTEETWNNNGQVSTVEYEYDCCGLARRKDRRSHEWFFTYNDLNQKISETNPKDLTTYFAYGLHGQPTNVFNALEWTHRSYTDEGWLTRLEYPQSAFTGNVHAENFWYDGEGRLIRRQGLAGEFHRFEHDAAGQRVAAFAPTGTSGQPWEDPLYVRTETNRYDALGRLVWSEDVRGLAISNEYNAVGQPVRRTYPDTTTEEWTYNTWGDPTSHKDRLGQVTSNIYDNVGRLLREIAPSGHSTWFSYNDADQLTSVTNVAMNYVWRYDYDAEGRVTQIIHPDNSQEDRWYDPMGNVTQSMRGGVVATITYDELNRRTSIVMDGELVETNGYDGLGRMIWSMNADGLAITNVYNNWGQLIERQWPEGLTEQFAYGDRGLTNQVDRLGIPQRRLLDTLGRVTSAFDGENNEVGYAYVTAGQGELASLTDGEDNLTRWHYDLFGSATNKVYDDDSFDRYRYDALNRLTNKVDAAGTSIAYSYDGDGNLSGIQYGATTPITFGYDPLNRRTNMNDHVGTTKWTVDAMGRITSESGPYGTAPVVAQYDDLGRMTNIAFGGHSVGYAYDGLGRITDIHAPEGVYAFDWLAGGVRRTQVDYPNGVIAVLGYDSLKRLDLLDYVHGTNVLLSMDYQYDAGDRRTNEVWSTGREVGYEYDLAHQLTLADSSLPSDSAAYAYDRAGNPLKRTELGLGVTNAFNNLNQIVSGVATGGVLSLTVSGGVNYHVGTVMVNNVEADFDPQNKTFRLEGVELFTGTNVLEAVYYGPPITNAGHIATSTVTVVLGETSYAHDDNGNLTEDANFHYHFDLANQLTNVVSKETAQSVFSARYDGLNRRVEVTRHGTNTERYVYFPASFNVFAVLDATNGVKEVYTHGPDLSGTLGGAGGIGGILHVTPLLGGAGGGFFYHADALGNVILTTDSSGETTSTHRYTPFGRPITSSGSYQPRFGFSSKEYAPETGLNYFGYRYLAVNQGRWTQRDPAGELFSENLYRFAANNPLLYADALGLAELSFQEPITQQRRNLIVVAGQDVGFGFVEATFTDVVGFEKRRIPSTPRNQGRAFAKGFNDKKDQSLTAQTIGALQGFSFEDLEAILRAIASNPLELAKVIAQCAVEEGIDITTTIFDIARFYSSGDKVSAAHTLGELTGQYGDQVLVAGLGGALRPLSRAERILKPGGTKIGVSGSSGSIRFLRGGEQEAQRTLSRLLGGGAERLSPIDAKVQVFRLQEGGLVKFRKVSSTKGVAATIDIEIPGIGIDRVKFVP